MPGGASSPISPLSTASSWRSSRSTTEADGVDLLIGTLSGSTSPRTSNAGSGFAGARAPPAVPSSVELDAARDELVGLARSYASVADLAEFLTAIALKKEEE